MNESKFRCAIFDMDGLMFDTEYLYVRSFEEAVGPTLQMDFPREKLLWTLGRNHASIEEAYPRLFGTAHSCAECYAVSNAWIDNYIRENGVPVKPGLRELLSYLKDCGVKIALATSTGKERALSLLKQADVLKYFDAFVCGDMVSHSKPDPEIFLFAAEQMGFREQLNQCVIFEDSKNGLLAAHAAGIPVIIVPDLLNPTEELPGLCYACVSDLAAAIPYL